MAQMVKNAASQTIKFLVASVKALLKLCIAVLKVLLFTTMFAGMVFGALSAFLAVGPMHTPSWMVPAWNTLNRIDPVRLVDALGGETSQAWEVHDSSIMISKWVGQFLPVADLMATAAGVAKEHWVRSEVELSMQHVNALIKSEPKVGQVLCGAWIISTLYISYLVVHTLIATIMLFGRCVRRVVRAVCPAQATATDAVGETLLPDGAGPTPKVELSNSTQALSENTRTNISTETSEKKGRRRLESPVVKNTKPKAKATAGKEDVPPYMESPMRRKQSELNELRQQGIVARRLRSK